ncbi:MAG: hypothetical protein WDZ51_04315 [Pirellulaceae bacterium]
MTISAAVVKSGAADSADYRHQGNRSETANAHLRIWSENWPPSPSPAPIRRQLLTLLLKVNVARQGMGHQTLLHLNSDFGGRR